MSYLFDAIDADMFTIAFDDALEADMFTITFEAYSYFTFES